MPDTVEDISLTNVSVNRDLLVLLEPKVLAVVPVLL